MSVSSPSSAPPGLSPTARSIVSLVLFVHLFAIAIALTSYTNPSGVQGRLREILGVYLQPLNFDLNQNAYNVARFHQTHATPNDVDFAIELEATLPDGSTRTMSVPEDGMRLPIRQRRYQSLVNAAGSMAESEEYQAVLPRAIAGSILRDWGVTSGKLTCRAHFLPDIGFQETADPKVSDPFSDTYYRSVYQATVIIAGDQVYVNKISEARDVAPVESASGTTEAKP